MIIECGSVGVVGRNGEGGSLPQHLLTPDEEGNACPGHPGPKSEACNSFSFGINEVFEVKKLTRPSGEAIESWKEKVAPISALAYWGVRGVRFSKGLVSARSHK